MKFILYILMFALCIYANTHECLLNQDKDLNTQIGTCKLSILKELCEQKGITVWSTSTVNNNVMQADEIKTDASCNVDIKINKVEISDDKITIKYSSMNSTQEVKEVTMEQWGAIKEVSHKVSASIAKVKRTDSTSLVDVAMNFQVDSKKIKERLRKLNSKCQRIAEIMLEND